MFTKKIKQKGATLVENLIALTILIGACTMGFKVILSEISTSSKLEKKVTLEQTLNYEVVNFLITDEVPTLENAQTTLQKINSSANGSSNYQIESSNTSFSKNISFIN